MTAIFNRRAGLTLATLAALGPASTAAQAQSVFTSWTFNNPPIRCHFSPRDRDRHRDSLHIGHDQRLWDARPQY